MKNEHGNYIFSNSLYNGYVLFIMPLCMNHCEGGVERDEQNIMILTGNLDADL